MKLHVSQYLLVDGAKLNITQDNGQTFMGLGERAGSFFVGSETYGVHTMWAFDQANPIDDAKQPGKNFYGV